MNKSGDQSPAAQNSSDLEKKTHEMSWETCPICVKYVKTGV